MARKPGVRLMGQEGHCGMSPRNKAARALRAPNARPAPHQVEPSFRVGGPHQLWAVDTTNVTTTAGLIYFAAVLDA